MADESIVARVPLHTEHASIDKRLIETGVVTINTSIENRIEHLAEVLMREEVFIERVPMGVEITAMPPVRTEDDVVVTPVVGRGQQAPRAHRRAAGALQTGQGGGAASYKPTFDCSNSAAGIFR
jgi:hypothetical protein